MQYGKYKAWLSGLNGPSEQDIASDMRVKSCLRPMYQDDTVRQMVGLKMLEDNIIDKGLFEIMLLNNIKNYF